MSFWDIADGRNVLFMTRDSEDKGLRLTYLRKKDIANKMVFVAGTTGSGKSVMANTTAHKMHKQGYTVIYVTEKPNAEFDNAFCMFPQEQEHLLRLMERMEIKPYDKEKCQSLGKLYHPFTFNIPDDKQPPINFFTFPLKYTDNEALLALFRGDMRSSAFEAVKSEFNSMKKKAGMFEMISNIGEDIGSSKEVSEYIDEFYQKVKKEGSENTRKTITTAFRPFLIDYFLASADCDKNLNFVDVCNDNKHIHFFSTRWISDDRSRVFALILLLKHIQRALKTGKVKRKLCIVIEEVKVLLPTEVKQDFEEVLSRIIVKLLSTIRVYAFVLATSQSYFKTPKDFRDACNEKFLGRVSEEDKESLIKYHNFTVDKINALNALRVGQFIRWDDFNSDEDIKTIMAPLPPFAIQTEGVNFFQKYASTYPSLMKDNKELKAEMKLRLEDEKALAKERYAKKQAKEEKNKEKKKAAKEEKVKAVELKKQSKKDKSIIKRAVWEHIQSFKKKNGEMPSWLSVGRKFSIDKNTAKKYYEEMEKSREDQYEYPSAVGDADYDEYAVGNP